MTDAPRAGRGPQTVAGVALRPSQHEAQTQLTAVTHARRLELFRHEVDALASRIVADCDRMLRAVGPDRNAWRAAIGRALLAARHAASACQAPIQPGEEHAAVQLSALEPTVRDALQPVVEAMGEIARHVPMSLADELMLADARSVRAMAATAQALSGREAGPLRSSRETGSQATDTAASARSARSARSAGSAGRAGTVGSAADDGGVARAGTGERASGAVLPVQDAPADGDHLAAPARILVADDTPEVRKALERLLTRMGHTVIAVANGREALEAAKTSPVDLVITDLDMPEMDGTALLEAIKASDALRHLPVIVVSSASDVERVAGSLERGADDHIGKPFQPALLEARVRSSLLRKRLRDVELTHLRRLAQITAAAEAVDRDAYVPGSLAGLAQGGDRLAHLARVFDRMVLHMRSREERLRARLRRLSVEMADISPSRTSRAVESRESPYASGQVLAGRYSIVGEVGRGGMGVVYHAMDRELHEDVAVKIVRADLMEADPKLADRLKSEIRLSRKLSHPNVLRAHDLGEFAGTYFITMEYVRGVSLLEMLDQRGHLSADATVALGIQLADALAAAHAEQIIHRDIKPANLLMDERGVLKVMDFGLAKVVKAEDGQTLRGAVVGTPQYMAPEQLMGGTLDARADLFAVGVVLYECLTGRPPYVADSPVSLVAQMVDGDYPRLAEIVADVPPRLADLVDGLLQLQPEARVQTAAELSRRLAELELAPPAGDRA